MYLLFELITQYTDNSLLATQTFFWLVTHSLRIRQVTSQKNVCAGATAIMAVAKGKYIQLPHYIHAYEKSVREALHYKYIL